MRLIDADRLLSDRMKSKYYHLPNGDIAIPIIDIEHAPTVNQWIPCSKRLPKNGYCLWSAKGGNVDVDFFWDGHWDKAEEYDYEVIAWQPLPEPYKGGGA